MPRRYFVTLLAFLLILSIVIMAALEQKQKVTPFLEGLMVPTPSSRAPCGMTKTSGTVASYWGSYTIGTGTYTYFDPEVECGAPTYPFEITDFTFVLYDFASIGQATVDVVVYEEAASGSSCDGPGTEVCREAMTITLFYPSTVTLTFATPCCVNGPFFIGVEYTSGTAGTIPSVFYDDHPAPDTCDNWMLYTDGLYYEWYDFWAQPGPGYPLYWVNGETVSPNCPGGCTWNPDDPHKMHFPQLPDETGWDVNATYPMILADDFECSKTGPIEDVHFWGSWRDDIEGEIQYFILSLHEDIPAGSPIDTCHADGDCDGNGVALTVADFAYLVAYLSAGGPPPVPLYSADLNGDCEITLEDATVYENYFVIGLPAFDPYGGYPVPTCCDETWTYSRPGQTLREWEVWDFGVVPFDPPTSEGWYDPATGEILWDNHYHYFQYNVCFEDPADWFYQDSGTIYWLNISAIVTDPVNTHWGWKSSLDRWNDDAVWAYAGELNWIDIWEPQPPVFNAWGVTMDIDGTFLGGWGENAYNDQWYYYEWYDWWNIWFYDHPFDPARWKFGWIEFDAFPYNPSVGGWLQIAVNWSTDTWYYDFPDDSMPPLPPTDEDLYIGRYVLFENDVYEGHYRVSYRLPPAYNPEWVSVDVRGYNFDVQGLIAHECRPSLNLAFVITGEEEVPPEACCFPDGSCFDLLPDDCITQGGNPMGPGTGCTGAMEACCLTDGSCVMADPFCCVNDLGGNPQGPGSQCTQTEACCMPDGTCRDLDPLCCIDQGGTPQGTGSGCSGTTQACCLTDGSCVMVESICCDELGGFVSPWSNVCLGDGNLNGIDDACEELKGACCLTDGTCLITDQADCEVALGGRYLGDGTGCLGDTNGNGIDDACETWHPGDPHKMHFPQLPDEAGWDVNATYPYVVADDFMCMQSGPITDIHLWGSWRNGITGNITGFVLSINSNVPAGFDQPFSHPGDELWIEYIDAFGVTAIDPPTSEGWYDPINGEVLPNDHNEYFQYDIYIPEAIAFPQDSGVIYWLTVSAMVDEIPTPTAWGWKSSQDHWEDDAVYGTLTVPDVWFELFEPGEPEPIINAFSVMVDEAGNLIEGWGDDAYGDGWYYYPWYDWWNVWFYDHPFAPERFKTIILDFDITQLTPGAPAYFEIAVNWSTDQWSLDQPPADSAPPLPGVDEDLYIGRATLFAGEFFEGHHTYSYQIPDYNPEWVSVDVRGYNFYIPGGFIEHTCLGQQSMDMAFVITSGICDCIPGDAQNDGTVNVADAVYLINYIFKGGPPPVPYRLCSGDANCDCQLNVGDAVFIINYVFKNGPAPCDCLTWLSICGPPLRK